MTKSGERKMKKKLYEKMLISISVVIVVIVILMGLAGVSWKQMQNPWSQFVTGVNGKIDKFMHIEEKRVNNVQKRNVMEEFELAYVACEKEEQKDGTLIKLAATGETQRKIDAFNEYMQNGSGKQYAECIGYTELPEGKLTMDFLMENQEKVVEMIDIWQEKRNMESDTEAEIEIYMIYKELLKNGQ